jgi:hypothetical protein
MRMDVVDYIISLHLDAISHTFCSGLSKTFTKFKLVKDYYNVEVQDNYKYIVHLSVHIDSVQFTGI